MASQVGLDLGTLTAMISVQASVKIDESRDGGIGRRVGLRIQCPKGVQVQILFPAPRTLTQSDVTASSRSVRASIFSRPRPPEHDGLLRCHMTERCLYPSSHGIRSANGPKMHEE